MFDRVGIVKSLCKEDKKAIRDQFILHSFGSNRLYAIGLVFQQDKIHLRLYNNPYHITKFNNDVLIGAGELHLLEETKETD